MNASDLHLPHLVRANVWAFFSVWSQVATHNTNFLNLAAHHDLEFAKCLQGEVKPVFVLVLVFENFEFQVAKLHWVFRQNHSCSNKFMAFKISWEKVLIWATVFKRVNHFEQLIPDNWLTNLLETDKVNSFKYGQFYLMNNLFGPFLFRSPPILLDNPLVIRPIGIISARTLVVSAPAGNVEIAIYA